MGRTLQIAWQETATELKGLYRADVIAQVKWKTSGLREALLEAEIKAAHRVWFSDEMRFGLWGQVRRRWGLQGVKIIQPNTG